MCFLSNKLIKPYNKSETLIEKKKFYYISIYKHL